MLGHNVGARVATEGPAALFAGNAKVRRELGWQPRYTDLNEIVDTAWQWRRRHPQGYRSDSEGPSAA